MKKSISVILIMAMVSVLFASCKKEEPLTVMIEAGQNEARAVELIEKEGLAEEDSSGQLKASSGNVNFVKVPSSECAASAGTADFAVMSSDTAVYNRISYKPVKAEDAASAVKNSIFVKDGKESSDTAKILASAIQSRLMKDFIEEEFEGNVKGLIINPGNGFSKDVNYERAAGKSISVVTVKGPHSRILGKAAEILNEYGIELTFSEADSFEQAENIMSEVETDACYFPEYYFEGNDSYVNIAQVHLDFMGIYSEKYKDFNILLK